MIVIGVSLDGWGALAYYDTAVYSSTERLCRRVVIARAVPTGGVGCREFSRLHAQTRMCTTAAGLVRPARDMTTLRCEIGSSR